MPSLIARMDASVFFIKPVFSKQASAATKLAELLGCGVPCLSNAGVGDMAEVLEIDCVGVALKAFDRASMLAGIDQLLELVSDPAITARCAAVAQKHFSLEEGVKRYRSIYEQLDNPSSK
jgi:glycosyltransferase involved in cell wall biosynthesis